MTASTTPSRVRALAGAGIAVLALVGCSGGTSSAPAGTSAPAATGSPSPSTSPVAGTSGAASGSASSTRDAGADQSGKTYTDASLAALLTASKAAGATATVATPAQATAARQSTGSRAQALRKVTIEPASCREPFLAYTRAVADTTARGEARDASRKLHVQVVAKASQDDARAAVASVTTLAKGCPKVTASILGRAQQATFTPVDAPAVPRADASGAMAVGQQGGEGFTVVVASVSNAFVQVNAQGSQAAAARQVLAATVAAVAADQVK